MEHVEDQLRQRTDSGLRIITQNQKRDWAPNDERNRNGKEAEYGTGVANRIIMETQNDDFLYYWDTTLAQISRVLNNEPHFLGLASVATMHTKKPSRYGAYITRVPSYSRARLYVLAVTDVVIELHSIVRGGKPNST